MVTTREKNKGMRWLWNGDETISAANRENEENDIAVEKKRKRFFFVSCYYYSKTLDD